MESCREIEERLEYLLKKESKSVRKNTSTDILGDIIWIKCSVSSEEEQTHSMKVLNYMSIVCVLLALKLGSTTIILH